MKSFKNFASNKWYNYFTHHHNFFNCNRRLREKFYIKVIVDNQYKNFSDDYQVVLFCSFSSFASLMSNKHHLNIIFAKRLLRMQSKINRNLIHNYSLGETQVIVLTNNGVQDVSFLSTAAELMQRYREVMMQYCCTLANQGTRSGQYSMLSVGEELYFINKSDLIVISK